MCGEGVHGGGDVAGGMHGRGCVFGRGGMHGGGACVAGETATAVGGTHPTGMHSCFHVLSSSFWLVRSLRFQAL